MQTHLKAVVMALCLATVAVSSASANIEFREGAMYQSQPNVNYPKFYMDLGDENADPNSDREGSVSMNSNSMQFQYGYPTFHVKLQITVIKGSNTASYYIGEGSSMTTISVPFQGDSTVNGMNLTVYAQSPTSSSKGVKLTIAEVNGEQLSASLSGVYSSPQSARANYGELYNFDLSKTFTLNGWIDMVNPGNASYYDFSVGLDFTHTELSGASVPEPTSAALLLGASGFLAITRRLRKK